MDIVYIQDLKVEALIGIYEWEQQQPQLLSIDLEMVTDCKKIAAHDAIEHALDYATISTQLSHFLRENHFQLIETLAEHLAQFILTNFQVSGLRLNLRKPGALPNAQTVGVRIERQAS